MNYDRITKWSDTHMLHVFDINDNEIPLSEVKSLDINLIAGHLVFLEDKIEGGELVDRNEYLDRLMAAKNISGMTDKEIEFFAKHNARVRGNADAEIARLTAENAALKKRLDNAVELPCIEPMTTWDWDDTTGLGKSNFGKYWKVVYRDEDGELMVYMGATKAEAEARLAELKGGRQ